MLEELQSEQAWESVLAIEPKPQRTLSDNEIAIAARAIADLTCDPTIPGRIPAPSPTLPLPLPNKAGSPPHEAIRLRRAVLLHDVGRTAITLSIWDKAAPNDLVAALHIHTGIHTGSFMGMPPTGRTIKVQGLELFRIQNGKITELWRHDDDAGLMRQLGMILMPAASQ